MVSDRGSKRRFSSQSFLLSNDAHVHRPLHKIHGVRCFVLFFRFLRQLLEHPVSRHLPLSAGV